MSNYYDVDPKSQEWTALMNQIIELNPQIYDSGRKMLGEQVTMNSVIYTGDNFILPANTQQPTPRAGGAGGAGAPSSEPASSTPASSGEPFAYNAAIEKLNKGDYDIGAIKAECRDGMTEDEFNDLIAQHEFTADDKEMNEYFNGLPPTYDDLQTLSKEELTKLYNAKGKVQVTGADGKTYSYQTVSGTLYKSELVTLDATVGPQERVVDQIAEDGTRTMFNYYNTDDDKVRSESVWKGNTHISSTYFDADDNVVEVITYRPTGAPDAITHPKLVNEYKERLISSKSSYTVNALLKEENLTADDIINLSRELKDADINLTDIVKGSDNDADYSTNLANFFERVAPKCSPEKLQDLVDALTGSNTTVTNAIQWNEKEQETTNLVKYYQSLLGTYKLPKDIRNSVDPDTYSTLKAQLATRTETKTYPHQSAPNTQTYLALSNAITMWENGTDPHLIMAMLCSIYGTGDDAKLAVEKMVQEYRKQRGGNCKNEQVELMSKLQNFIFACLGS